MIETERLILRPFRMSDGAAFAEINADEAVRYWLGGAQTRAESDAAMLRNIAYVEEHGFGFMAVERRADRRLIGMAGVRALHPTIPLPPALEVGWRLARDCWGEGYASEAARAALDDAFRRTDAETILATTAKDNLRSQAVMRRLGMLERSDLAFDHPELAENHPLRAHVVFETGRQAATMGPG